MTDPTLQAQIDAATAYDTIMVPAMMEDWAIKVADAATLKPGQRVLDVACGTGVLARAAIPRVQPGGSVAGLDKNPGMLAVAASIAPDVAWREGTAESLPFADGTFDAVACQFGLMFCADRRAALGEMRRVLAPGGRMAVAVWAALDRAPGFAAFVELLQRVSGTRAADALRLPFALGDADELAALCAGAGLASPRIVTLPGTARFPSVAAWVRAEVLGWLPIAGLVLPEDEVRVIAAEASHVLARFASVAGMLEFPAPAHVVTAGV